MHPETAHELDDRARQCGATYGWPLRFRVAPGDLFAGLTVCWEAGERAVFDYAPFGEAAAHAAHWDLDRLEVGQYRLHDGKGGPVLVRFMTAAEIIAWAERPPPQ